jgi:histidine triad (HIT) family protein
VRHADREEHLHGHLLPRTADDGLALPWTHPTREQEPTR